MPSITQGAKKPGQKKPSKKVATPTSHHEEFYDHGDCPERDVANGGFAMLSGGGAVAIGWSCSKITIGHLFSNFGCGLFIGLDLGASLLVGSSVVSNVEETCCNREG